MIKLLMLVILRSLLLGLKVMSICQPYTVIPTMRTCISW
ncbi:putative membrane protein [Pseudomonas syringae pv. cerasicola]|nr:putative membrane protein [Pseudomonas syringae pv. cerasicola]